MTVALADPEAELSATKVHLARCLQQQHDQEVQLGSLSPNSPESLLLRARKAADKIDLLELSRRVANLVSGTVSAATTHDNGNGDTSLAKATEMCTALGLLLLRSNNSNSNNNPKSNQFRIALVRWYESIHDASRRAALADFRAGLRRLAPDYPSSERSAALLAEALASPDEDGSPAREEWRAAARCLVELQVVHDALRDADSVAPSQWRLDLVDELSRPLAERLRFHFLEERTGMAAAATSDVTSSSKVDRLPEWLFRYLREVTEDHGVHTLISVGAQPLVDAVMDSLLARAAAALPETADVGLDRAVNDPEETNAAECDLSQRVMERLQQPYRRRSCATYFMREVARMARHALRAKSFFRHPDVLGSECRDRNIVLRGIEQLFLFDAFIAEQLAHGEEEATRGGAPHWQGRGERDDSAWPNDADAPPWMVDTFLSSEGFLLEWWLEEERDGVLLMLHQCAAATLSSYQTQHEEAKDGPSDITDTPAVGRDGGAVLCLPVAELFVVLLHSAKRKVGAFHDSHSRGMYVARVIAPLCSTYLDLVHTEAAQLRRRLVARPPAGVRRAGLPPESSLVAVTTEWAALITGTYLAARAVLLLRGAGQLSGDALGKHNSPHKDPSWDGMERVGAAMVHLRDALVEDFTATFVETLVMERAKLAAYTMRAPFLLSEPPPRSLSERRGQRKKDANGRDNISLSPDLNDSIRVTALAADVCNATMRKLGEMCLRDEHDDKRVEQGALVMLYFGSRAIHEALRFAIGQKLLDVAIDPQGMTPEIYATGARQFLHDVTAFESVFSVGGDGDGNGTTDFSADKTMGPMERAVTAARLMSLEPTQLQTIREALRALLAIPAMGVGSLFGRIGEDGKQPQESNDHLSVNYRLNADDFYRDERLLVEANNMIEAKGFAALSLDESLSIINRRC